MKTATATTFEVSDVKRATDPLPEVPYKQAIEALLTKGGIDDDDEWEDEPGHARAEAPSPRPIEACTRYHGRLLGGNAFHPVMAAVHRSFMGHRPVILSPDIVWLMVVPGRGQSRQRPRRGVAAPARPAPGAADHRRAA